jgi:hypothetical protein
LRGNTADKHLYAKRNMAAKRHKKNKISELVISTGYNE